MRGCHGNERVRAPGEMGDMPSQKPMRRMRPLLIAPSMKRQNGLMSPSPIESVH